MNYDKAFRILEIQKTKEENVIRTAYRKKLVTVNPEDDPKGFQRLREAYEEALSYSKKEEKDDSPKDIISVFMGRVETVYQDLSRRVDLQEWKVLVEDEIFQDLELGEKAKWEFFTYLSLHFRLEAEIWELFCDFFYIPENEKEFKEHLPVEFVDFILREVEEEGRYNISLKKFQGDPKADYDGFIREYNELVRMINERPEDKQEEYFRQIEEQIREMEKYEIFHPWLTLEQARFALKKEDLMKAEHLLMGIWEERKDDRRLRYEGAVILKACHKIQEASDIFLQFTKEEGMDGYVYGSLIEMGRICLDRKEFEEGKNYLQRALGVSYQEDTIDLLIQCSEGMIEQYTSKETLSEEEEYKLCQAFLEAKKNEEGLEYVKKHHLLRWKTAKSHQLKSSLLFHNNLYEETIEETRLWREALKNEGQDDKIMLARSLDQEGKAYHNLWWKLREGEHRTEERRELGKKALSFYQEAINLSPEDIRFKMSKMLCLRDLEYYDEMAALCEQIIDLEPNYYWGYYYAQEAHMRLRNAQEVIDYFYKARGIYSGEPKLYERVAEVFSNYRKYDDLKQILELAEEAGATSHKIRLYQLEYEKEQAKTEEECVHVDQMAEAMIQEMEGLLKVTEPIEEKKDLEEILSLVYMERVYLCEKPEAQKLWDYYRMKDWMTRAIQLDDTNWNRYYRGRFYVINDKLKESYGYEDLKLCKERGMDFGWMYYFLGGCKQEAKNGKEQLEAIENYKKALEKLPEESCILWRIAYIYRNRLEDYGQLEDGEQALYYAKAQEEKFGYHAYENWQISRIYEYMGDLKSALKEIENVVARSCSAYYLSQNAYILDCMGRFEEAKEKYQKAIVEKRRETQEGDYLYAYKRVCDMYIKLQQYDEGVSFFRKEIERLGNPSNKDALLNHIKCIYVEKKDWTMALKTIEERYGYIGLDQYGCDTWTREGERIEDLLDLYEDSLPLEELKKRVSEAVRLMKEKRGRNMPGDKRQQFNTWQRISSIYRKTLLEDQKAVYYGKKFALPLAKSIGMESEEFQDILDTILPCLQRLDRKEEVKEYVSLYKESLRMEYAPYNTEDKPLEELYVGRVTRRRAKLYHWFLLFYYEEKYEEAQKCKTMMKDCYWCYSCNEQECFEEWMMEGFMALTRQEEAKALEYFKRADEACTGGSLNAQEQIARLKRKGIG